MLSPHRLLIYVSCLVVIGFELFSFNEALHEKIYYTGGKKSAQKQYVKPTTVCFTYNYLLFQPGMWTGSCATQICMGLPLDLQQMT